jgi:molecular chaperone GrpE
MSETKESAAERAIREALESVERIERDGKKSAAKKTVDATDEEADLVQILDTPEGPPSAHASSDDAQATPAAPAAAKPAKKSASDALLEATIKAKQEMAEVLAQTQKEAKDMFDRLARVSADFDNFKKRVQREKADAIKFGNEGLLKELLPVVDNMNRAVAALTAAAAGTPTSSDDKLLEGIKLVAKQFDDTLAKVGVVGFPALGQPFDPARHEAVGARPDDKIAAQHVCEEYQRGYMLHDRLLRPALVIVSAGPANGATPSGSGEPATEN